MKQKTTYKLTIFFCALPVFLLAVFFVYCCAAKAENSPKIVITKVQITGGTGKTEEDFIELYNDNSKPVLLEGFKLKKKTKTGTESSLKSFEKEDVIPAKGYFLWINSSLKSRYEYDVYSSGTISADNSSAIFDADGKILDAVAWGSGHSNPFVEGETFPTNPEGSKIIYRKKSGDDFNDSNNNRADFEISDRVEPKYGGCRNDAEREDCKVVVKCNEEVADNENLLIINEILPNPAQKNDEGEYVELFNGSSEKIPLAEFSFSDKACGENYKKTVWPSDKDTISGGSFVLFNADKIDITLANSKDVLYFCKKSCEISHVAYSNAKENLAYAFDGKKWRWTKFLTPGKENIFNNLPEEKKTLIPDKAYVNVYAEFYVKVSDRDGDKTKVTWDFGDGHKSYKNETKHKYQKEGKYTGSLKITDGSEDVIKEFTIEVEDYPERKVRIVAINANPVGKDTEGESITVLNKSKKKINFNGWSVATGANSKKLVNHPIKEDFEIKSGKTGEITRDICALTLNNKKGVVELRYPGGEVAHDIKYKKENKESIEEGEIYEKKEEKWEWGQTVKSEKSKVKSEQDNNKQLTTDDLQQDLEIDNSNNMNVEDTILPEEVGKKSEIEIENKLEENPYLESTSLPSKPSVLGIATVRVTESSYHFTPETTPEEHYAIVFLRKAGLLINYSINKVISHFL